MRVQHVNTLEHPRGDTDPRPPGRMQLRRDERVLVTLLPVQMMIAVVVEVVAPCDRGEIEHREQRAVGRVDGHLGPPLELRGRVPDDEPHEALGWGIGPSVGQAEQPVESAVVDESAQARGQVFLTEPELPAITVEELDRPDRRVGVGQAPRGTPGVLPVEDRPQAVRQSEHGRGDL